MYICMIFISMNLDNIKHFFIFRVFKTSIWLGITLSVFIIGQLFFTYKAVECFPFVHYGMYSEQYQRPDSFLKQQFNVEIVENTLSKDFLTNKSEYLRQNEAVYDPNMEQIDKYFKRHQAIRSFLVQKIIQTPEKQILFKTWYKNYLITQYGDSSYRFIKIPLHIDS